MRARFWYYWKMPGEQANLLAMQLCMLPVGRIRLSCMQVRFVEDNWENPALGAWGLGWEVWMDGARPPHADTSSSSRIPTTHAGLACRRNS